MIRTLSQNQLGTNPLDVTLGLDHGDSWFNSIVNNFSCVKETYNDVGWIYFIEWWKTPSQCCWGITKYMFSTRRPKNGAQPWGHFPFSGLIICWINKCEFKILTSLLHLVYWFFKNIWKITQCSISCMCLIGIFRAPKKLLNQNNCIEFFWWYILGSLAFYTMLGRH